MITVKNINTGKEIEIIGVWAINDKNEIDELRKDRELSFDCQFICTFTGTTISFDEIVQLFNVNLDNDYDYYVLNEDWYIIKG